MIFESKCCVGAVGALNQTYLLKNLSPDRWIQKRVHLFRDDVGLAPYGACEEFGWLEKGETDFAVAESGEDFVGGLLDAIPEGGFRRQQIPRATDRLEFPALFFFCCCVAQWSPQFSFNYRFKSFLQRLKPVLQLFFTRGLIAPAS